MKKTDIRRLKSCKLLKPIQGFLVAKTMAKK